MCFELSKYYFCQIEQKQPQKIISEKETFHVGSINSSSLVSLPRKLIYGISAIVSLGLIPLTLNSLSSLIARIVLPALTISQAEKQRNKLAKEAFIKLMPKTVQEFDLKMEDGAIINGMGVFKDSDNKKDFCEGKAENQKWMIHFNGNMQFYENHLYDAQHTCKNLNANILVFNYRGVGESQGFPLKAEDLISDGEACVKYLLSKGVSEENILIQGLSLGGGVGTQVASLHEKIALVSERSFSSLSQIATALLNRPSIGKILIALGWELDSVEAYEKIKASKIIVYHKQDAVMPYAVASLYKIVKERIKQQNPHAVSQIVHKGKLKNRLKEEFKPARVKLQHVFSTVTSNAHVYDLKRDQAYPEIKNFIKNFFRN